MTYQKVIIALADSTRLAIFDSLRNGPRSVGEIAAGFPISRPAVSQHLKVLKTAGLVAEEKKGVKRFYRINHAGIQPLRQYLDSLWNEALAQFKTFVEKENSDEL